MSNEFEFRRHRRERERKNKMRRNFFRFVFSLVIITVFLLGVKGILTKNSKKPQDNYDIIFNDYIYPQPPEKNSDILVDAVKADGIKKAYVTFDDGPNTTVTPLVLDTLRKYNVKATFFMVGSLIEKNPAVARRVYDEGHCLANHSYNHNYGELYADGEAFMSQIRKTKELIDGITCDDNYPKIMRFPGGGYNAGSKGKVKQDYKLLLKDVGYRYCDWNSLTGDAEKVSPDADYIMNSLKRSTNGKEDVVILMHDAIAKKITAQTLPQVLEYLLEQGYEFDTLNNV